MERVRNEEVRRRAGIERALASRADQRVLRWCLHVERMDEYLMARKVLMTEISGANKKALAMLLKPASPTPSNTGSLRSFHRDTDQGINIRRY